MLQFFNGLLIRSISCSSTNRHNLAADIRVITFRISRLKDEGRIRIAIIRVIRICHPGKVTFRTLSSLDINANLSINSRNTRISIELDSDCVRIKISIPEIQLAACIYIKAIIYRHHCIFLVALFNNESESSKLAFKSKGNSLSCYIIIREYTSILSSFLYLSNSTPSHNKSIIIHGHLYRRSQIRIGNIAYRVAQSKFFRIILSGISKTLLRTLSCNFNLLDYDIIIRMEFIVFVAKVDLVILIEYKSPR